MKVITDMPDKYGKNPLWFKGGTLKEIHDYLFDNYQGYIFCIMFDTTKDEYTPLESPVPVYFADELLPELAYFYDYSISKKHIAEPVNN